MSKTILIASASFDEHAYGPVSRLLEDRGCTVVVYKTDRLLTGTDRFVVDLRSGSPAIRYNDVTIGPEDLGAAWYRKVGSFGLPDVDSQLAKQLYMNNEVRALHDTIWPQFYPDSLWLSAPSNLAKADRKLGQLLTARAVGFTVPDTLVSSRWEAISDALLTDDDQIIVKMMRGVISHGNEIRALPTTILDARSVETLAQRTSPFPGLFQPFVKKAREWRVTVVRDDVFPVAIYTDDSAKDDWRKHQNTEAVRFVRETLPAGVDDLCVRYLDRMALGFGAFDLIETPDGEVVFLECNPNGQNGWLEEDLGLPISEAIAAELLRLAGLP